MTTLRGVAPRTGPPICLTIAGSDSGGGAGIQADLKAFAACGAHGTTAVTALTAQNTVGVTAVEAVSPAMIVAQVAAIVADMAIDAVKVGMLGSKATAGAVADALRILSPGTPVVVDPVMVSESGARLLEPEAQEALVDLILPLATVLTPNVGEARVLAGAAAGPGDDAEMQSLIRAIHALGPTAVIITGGHRDVAVDTVFDGEAITLVEGPRYPDGAAHGSGCTHSSALTAALAHGLLLTDAARVAKRVASGAVRDGLRTVGKGPGPVDALGIERWSPASPASPTNDAAQPD